MNTELIIGIIGTIASLVGAFISWNEARKAKNEKNEVIKIKNYMVERYDQYEDTKLRAKIIAILQGLGQLKNKNPGNLLLGKNIKTDLQECESLLHEIMTLKIYEISDIKNNVSESLDFLNLINITNYGSSIDKIIYNLANISRKIDIRIKS
ncbi:hypothetical protein [Leptospira adleri]|uniref:hypothetical protein n=1 Tax=Leptospira adleri TaxID=2023186 RepID=UPI0010835DBD|nr:hypothetical protein [Leptospira adleri]TGM58569.1 hypothetical protein EHQ97_05580 [Leptospira adleri]